MGNKEISFLELNTEAFECAEKKNRFIQTTKTEWIGFVDGDVTSKEEVWQIIEENPFLMDYEVVLFGADVPEGECGQLELLKYPQGTIYAICCRRKLLIQTGSFNRLLGGSTNYEFLLRLAKIGTVYSIPCSATKNVCFDPITMAYIVRNYMAELKEAGMLDETFLHIMQMAERLGLKEQFSAAMNSFLTDAASYERIVMDTAPCLIMIGNEICSGVVRDFGNLLADALVELGQAVIATNDKYGNYQKLSTELILNQFYKAIIGFQAPALGKEVFRKMQGKHYQIWFDNPVFSVEHFMTISKQVHVLCHDADYARFIREHYLIEQVTQFPLAGDARGINRGEEVYDLVFIGSYLSCSEENYEEGFRKDFYQYMREHASCTVEQGIRALWQERGLPYNEQKFMETIVELWDVCYDLMQNYRHDVIETILNAGIQMHVFGDSWKKYQGLGAENLIFHPEVCGKDALEVWSKAKVGLNIMNGHKHGMTERIANIMLCGACCLSDETSYLKENFRDGEELVLFRGEELERLPAKIQYLLQHDEERKRIALAGKKRAQREHTWRRRAEELLEIIEKDSEEGR